MVPLGVGRVVGQIVEQIAGPLLIALPLIAADRAAADRCRSPLLVSRRIAPRVVAVVALLLAAGRRGRSDRRGRCR